MLVDSEFSVIVQGQITFETKKCLKSIRKFLPHSEVILSTWNECEVVGLDYDILVQNNDPGAVRFSTTEYRTNNLNRILISSYEGIKKATRKYVLIMRSDMVMYNDNILRMFDEYKRNSSFILFKQRIFAYEMYSLKFEEGKNRYYTPFHISDWCRFGVKEDLEKLFNISLISDSYFSLYFKDKMPDPKDIWPERLWKMSPEQYICSQNYLKIAPKNFEFKDRLDWSKEILDASDAFIVNNFVIKSIKDWGIEIQKKDYKKQNIKSSEITKNGAWLGYNWFEAYQKYCDSQFVIPLKYTLKKDLHIEREINHFQKHLKKAIKPINKFINWVNQISSTLFYGIKICLKSLKYVFVLVFKK